MVVRGHGSSEMGARSSTRARKGHSATPPRLACERLPGSRSSRDFCSAPCTDSHGCSASSIVPPLVEVLPDLKTSCRKPKTLKRCVPIQPRSPAYASSACSYARRSGGSAHGRPAASAAERSASTRRAYAATEREGSPRAAMSSRQLGGNHLRRWSASMPRALSYLVRPRKASKAWKSGTYSPDPPGDLISGLMGE